MERPSPEALPGWYTALTQRAHAELPDQDLKDCLAYVDSLRRQRDRLLSQLAKARVENRPAGMTILDRFDAALTYLEEQNRAGVDAVPVNEVARRLNGREA